LIGPRTSRALVLWLPYGILSFAICYWVLGLPSGRPGLAIVKVTTMFLVMGVGPFIWMRAARALLDGRRPPRL
jgi:hypothetical protein